VRCHQILCPDEHTTRFNCRCSADMIAACAMHAQRFYRHTAYLSVDQINARWNKGHLENMEMKMYKDSFEPKTCCRTMGIASPLWTTTLQMKRNVTSLCDTFSLSEKKHSICPICLVCRSRYDKIKSHCETESRDGTPSMLLL